MTTKTARLERIVVLGANSAIAEAMVRQLAPTGTRFALAGRRGDRLEAIADDLRVRGARQAEVFEMDLAQVADAGAALAEMSAAIGGADAVFLFYGVLGDQKLGERDADEARRILEVNFTSQAAWLLAAADQFESGLRHGPPPVVVAITSVAGDRGRRSNYIYGAAKGGVSILMQGISHRFAASGGGRAVAMKLGQVDTPMTDGLSKSGPLWARPDQVAAAIVKAARRGGPVVYAPWFWRYILLAIRLMPAAIFNKVNI
jgi:short-subunit dehydrogenase